jgi:hypothetical protein
LSARAVAVVALAVLVAAGCGNQEDAAAPAGDLIAFTITEWLGIGCPGIWTVDLKGDLRWVAGTARAPNAPGYPAFQHDGRLTVGVRKKSEAVNEVLPLIDVVSLEDGHRLAADVDAQFLPLPTTWSPSRAQLLALVPGRGRIGYELVRVDAEDMSIDAVAVDPGSDAAWLGNGDSIAYLTYGADKSSLWVASNDGGEARLLARRVDRQFAASPDGKRIAFRRLAPGSSFLNELWIVDVESAEQRRLPGPLLPGRPSHDVWLDERTLIVHDRLANLVFDRLGPLRSVTRAIRVDVQSGERALLAADAEVLEASRDGSTLLAIREQWSPLAGDHVLLIMTMRADGTGRRVLAVAEPTLENIPVLQPVKRELTVAEHLAPPRGLEPRCRSKLIALAKEARRG